jgi:hypothetical protein
LDKQNFFNALISNDRNATLPEEYDYFGKLIGSWKIDYVDNSNSRVIKGEWHFTRVLEGMAIQDVIILPGFECGTTLRIYNPDKKTWNAVYCYAEKIMRLQARRQDGMIILTHLDDEKRKWVFKKIEDNSFHWQDVRIKDDGTWLVSFDLYADRV